jgi:membrane protease YdiL (CAAX protease family)
MAEFLALSLPSILYLIVRRRDPLARRILGLTWPGLRGWLLGLLVAVIGLGIGWLATRGVPADLLYGPGTSGQITDLLAGVVVALRALGEEVFFRGVVQGIVARRWGVTAGIIVQGVAFLVPHLLLLTISPALTPLVAGQFVIGLLLGWLRHHTGSVAPGVLAHVVTNVAAGLRLSL